MVVRSTLTWLLFSFVLLAVGVPAVLGANDGTANPCKVVTSVNARAALGATVPAATPISVGLYQNCTYRTATGKTLIVLVRKLSQPDFDKSAKANPGKVVAVTGIGSAAFSVQGSTLLFWRNGTEVTLSIVGVPGPLQTEERLAKTVAGGL